MDTDLFLGTAFPYPNPSDRLRDNEAVAMTFATSYLIKRIREDRVRLGLDPSTVDVHNIGQGSCYHWAMLVYLLSDPGRVTLCSTGDFSWHAFVKIDGLYYDAANPQGVQDWRDLNAMYWKGKLDNFVRELTEDQFIAGWPRILDHLALWRQIAAVVRGPVTPMPESLPETFPRTYKDREGNIYFFD